MTGLSALIGVWLVLCLVLVAYVAYRFISDRPDSSPQHPMYPLVSKPTDRSLPKSGAWLEWVAYGCLLLGLAGLLVVLASESGLVPRPQHVVAIAGTGAIIGAVLLVIVRVGGRK
jgi:hypothetical protein